MIASIHGSVTDPAVLLILAGYAFLLASSGGVVALTLSLIPPADEQHGDTQERTAADDPTPTADPEDAPAPEPGGGRDRGDPGEITEVEQDIGTVIGKCENVLVVSFLLVGAYTGLAIIFAAKSIVRREDIRTNTRYYLAGTLVNFTYSVALGLLVLGGLRAGAPSAMTAALAGGAVVALAMPAVR